MLPTEPSTLRRRRCLRSCEPALSVRHVFRSRLRFVSRGSGLLPSYLQNVGHVFRLAAAGSPCDNKECYRRNRQNGCEYGEPKSIGGDFIISRLGMRNIIAFVCSALFTAIVLLIFACANRKRINRKGKNRNVEITAIADTVQRPSGPRSQESMIIYQRNLLDLSQSPSSQL